MDAADALSHLERSRHTAFTLDNTLFIWGGVQTAVGENIVLPSDEMWLCDLDTSTWQQREMGGDKPPDLSGSCGSCVQHTFYIFAGRGPNGYTNEMFSVDLSEQCYMWTRVTGAKGTTPSPRSNHSCWTHRDRLIYFGGYGYETRGQNTSSSSFSVEAASWATVGNGLYRCWGWNNHVSVFDTGTAAWSAPQVEGAAPSPRCYHASALLGNTGFVCGGQEPAELEMFCLDLETWCWTRISERPQCNTPLGRSMFTMTAVSDHTLLIYGGISGDRKILGDAWQFDTQTGEWTRRTRSHLEQPRVCHSASLTADHRVVVFGGRYRSHVLADSAANVRTLLQCHHGNVLIFQTRPYSLCRLCEDLIGRNPELFGRQLHLLPSKLRVKVEQRVAAFSAAAAAVGAPLAVAAH